MSYLANALSLILQFVFGLAVALFGFRLLAEAVRADFHNPISQFLYRATNPVLAPLRRAIPNWRRINIAALLIIWLLEVLKNFLLRFTTPGFWASNTGIWVLGFADLADFFAMTYLVVVLIWAVLSWVTVDARNPLVPLLNKVVQPLLRPFQRFMPRPGGFDLSPMVLILVILLLQVTVIAWLTNVGHRI